MNQGQGMRPQELQAQIRQRLKAQVRRRLEALNLSADDQMLLAEMLNPGNVAAITRPVSIQSICEDQADRANGWSELLKLVEHDDALFRPEGSTEQHLQAVQDLQNHLRNITEVRARLEDLRTKLIAAAGGSKHGESLNIAYHYALDGHTVESYRPQNTFSGCVGFLMENGNLDLVFRFIEWYCKCLEYDGRPKLAAALRAACDEVLEGGPVGAITSDWLHKLREHLEPMSPEHRWHVLFRIDNKTVNGLSAWRYPGGWLPNGDPNEATPLHDAIPLPTSGDPVETLDELHEEVRAVCEWLLDLDNPENSKPGRPVIEFMGEWKWLHTPDETQVRSPAGNSGKLGHLAPVVIRLSDCNADQEHYRRWRSAHENNGAPPSNPPIQYITNGTDPIKETSSGLAICYTSNGLDDIHSDLRQFRNSGIRIATWSRLGVDIGRIQNKIKEVADGRQLFELVDEIWRRRQQQEDEESYDLALLWDDPHWYIEDNALDWRPASP